MLVYVDNRQLNLSKNLYYSILLLRKRLKNQFLLSIMTEKLVLLSFYAILCGIAYLTENLYTVVVSYFSPAFKSGLTKPSWLIAFG